MEIGKVEGAIVLILEQYKAHFDLMQKIDHLFCHEICSLKSGCFGTFVKVSIKEQSSLLNILYHSVLKAKVLRSVFQIGPKVIQKSICLQRSYRGQFA